jgi:hypothetical protein
MKVVMYCLKGLEGVVEEAEEGRGWRVEGGGWVR